MRRRRQLHPVPLGRGLLTGGPSFEPDAATGRRAPGARWYDHRHFRGTSTTAPHEDLETAAGFLRGEAGAVALMDKWIAGAAAPFHRRLGGELPDLLQEARIEVLRLLRRSSWRGEARLKTYVWSVVAHTCLDAVRRHKRRPVHEPTDPEAPIPSTDPSPLERVLQTDSARILLAALASVPADCRELWGRILRGQSYREMGAEMGIAEGALRVRAHRCRKRAVEALGRNAAPLRAAQG